MISANLHVSISPSFSALLLPSRFSLRPNRNHISQDKALKPPHATTFEEEPDFSGLPVRSGLFHPSSSPCSLPFHRSMLTTELLPLSKAIVTIGSSMLLTGAAFEHFLVTHDTPESYSATWAAATHEAADGHVHRVASPVDVELNPVRRLREHEKEARASTSRPLHVSDGWFA